MTDEQIATALWPGSAPARSAPARAAPAQEEAGEPEAAQSAPPARAGRPAFASLLMTDDRLQEFLEKDIERMEAEALRAEQEAERNLATEDELA